MSNANYNVTARAQPFGPIALLATDVDQDDITFSIFSLVLTTGNDLFVGMGALIDDEVLRLDVITDTTLTFARGCADTIPAPHIESATIWFIDGYLGMDTTPYMATETIGVKIQPRTTSQTMDIAYSPPESLTFSHRFIRPYPVAQFKVNAGNFWAGTARLTAVAPNLALTWVERNRVVQADQLLSFSEAGVAAEAGTTYRATLYTAGDSQVSVRNGVTSGFAYTRTMAVQDFGLVAVSDTGDYPAYLIFTTVRDGYTAWQHYRVDFVIDTTGLVTYLKTEDALYLTTEDGRRLILE